LTKAQVLNHRDDCRVCHGKDVVKFLSLGDMPLAGGFIREADIPNERRYPLDVFFCRNCSLVQVMDTVPAEVLFKDYRYLSSSTQTLVSHFEKHASDLVKMYGFDGRSLAVEIGPNDGILMAPLASRGLRVYGFEPAENIARVAVSRGLNIIVDFFTEKNARDFVKLHGKVDLILANNVFAHIDDIDEVMKGILALLGDDGVFVFEVHYILDLIEKMQFDTIYHEHLCYYSVKALQTLLGRFGMEITRISRIPIHSGSISVHAKRKSAKSDIDSSVGELLDTEAKHGLHGEPAYKGFQKKVNAVRDEIRSVIKKISADGKKIVCYGAPGRGTIFLNYVGLGRDVIDYAVDESPERYGRVVPGVHIPIYPPKKFREDIPRPDYALILAWSYESEIIRKEKQFLAGGGKFIVPLPKVRIVE
jgi:SAM-dependent methyltransferase